MTFKIILGLLLIITRLFLGVKVISWIILKFISNIPHPISEIEVYLVLMFLDLWFSSQPTEIIVKKIED
jgi:hypothetical protein